jgi:hypothetical protein
MLYDQRFRLLSFCGNLQNLPERNVLWIFRLWAKRSLGQSSPWTKHPRQICDKTSPFSGTDCLSLKINLAQFFRTKRPWPTKKRAFWFLTHFLVYTFHRPRLQHLNNILCAAPAPLLLPWQPRPGGTASAAWPQRRSPAVLAAQPRLGRENDAALAPGPFCEKI